MAPAGKRSVDSQEESQTAQTPPGSEPRWVSSAYSAYSSAIPPNPMATATKRNSQPVGLRGCRDATSAPTNPKLTATTARGRSLEAALAVRLAMTSGMVATPMAAARKPSPTARRRVARPGLAMLMPAPQRRQPAAIRATAYARPGADVTSTSPPRASQRSPGEEPPGSGEEQDHECEQDRHEAIPRCRTPRRATPLSSRRCARQQPA